MRKLISLVIFLVVITTVSTAYAACTCCDGLTMVIRADNYPVAGDACQKIAAAIAALPSGGGYIDAKGFTNPQNCTGFSIPPGVTVDLAPVLFTLSGSPIIVNNGATLKGNGRGNPGSTKIKAANGHNQAIIQAVSTGGVSGFWHAGIIANLWLDGNKANLSQGNCIEVYQMGEMSRIEYLNISDCKESGMYIFGSQSGTNSIENVTVNNNTLYGVEFDQFRSTLLLKSVGGDDNPITFGITNTNNGGGTIHLLDPKSEGINVNPVILITGGNTSVNLLIQGGNFLNQAGTPGEVIKIEASAVSPVITLMGTHIGNDYPTLINDLKTSHTVTTATSVKHGIFAYYNGAIKTDNMSVGTLLP